MARLVFLGKCHDSMAGTGSICTAAASRVPDSTVRRVAGSACETTGALRIGHPLGVMEVKVSAETAGDPASTRFLILGLTRTARRLMAGDVFLPV
ncbi:PrpF domain-containing protein [Variovorax sp. H27-G14]|uniref:PrpF domain-containing protein n=1 Tax=Variovorax sp. H27-G14 TaxID=3111914 RepID=UPI0038FC00BF